MGGNENPNSRLMALSDGVISVAITLLVLDIRLPQGFGEYPDTELWAALVALWPRLLAYLLSFYVIANFWMSHRAKFEHIVRTDGRLMWINMLFLLTVGLVPFTTNLIAESGGTISTMVTNWPAPILAPMRERSASGDVGMVACTLGVVVT